MQHHGWARLSPQQEFQNVISGYPNIQKPPTRLWGGLMFAGQFALGNLSGRQAKLNTTAHDFRLGKR